IRSRATAQTAALWASSAGCALWVSVSSSAGPSKQRRLSAKPNAASARSKTARASGKASARSFPMPGFCEPWPGNKRTMSMLEAQHHRRPSKAGAERDEQHGHAILDPTILERLVERDWYGGRGGVPISVHVHVDLFHRDIGVLRRRLDDAHVRLMRDEQIDVLTGELGAVEGAIAGVGHGADRVLEDFATSHLHVEATVLEHVLAERHAGTAAGTIEQVCQRSVAAQISAEYSLVMLRATKYGGAGS